MTVTITGGRSAVTVSADGSAVTITGSRTGATITQPSTGGGVTDHGALTGLADDDHTQYHTDARGDARYDATGTAAAAVTAHAGATDPHGDRSFTTSAISTHAGAADPHGDRAYAAGLVDDLSGVTSASTARANLGLGTAATTAATDYATASHNHSGVYDPAGTAATAVSAAAWSPVVCQLGAYPSTPTTSGSWSVNSAASAVSLFPYWAGPNTQNAYIEFANWLWLHAGTYDLWLHGNRNTDKGIATVAFGGSSVGAADFYGASAAIYAVVATGVVVASSGFLALRLTAATKNASSSGYALRASTLVCQRTA